MMANETLANPATSTQAVSRVQGSEIGCEITRNKQPASKPARARLRFISLIAL